METYLLLVFGVVSIFIIYRFQWLSKPGIVIATIFGLIWYLAFGWLFLLFPFLFLATGSLSAKLLSNKKESNRNAIQVFSNGFIAFLLAIAALIMEQEILRGAFVLSFAIALSDTLSSDLGRKYGSEPFHILNGKKLSKGLSGGITWIGTVFGLFGSLMITIPYYLISEINSKSFFVLTLFGFIGMLIDSILGALYQAKYLNDGHLNECGQGVLYHGKRWINNDVVNLLANLTTTVLFLLYLNL